MDLEFFILGRAAVSRATKIMPILKPSERGFIRRFIASLYPTSYLAINGHNHMILPTVRRNSDITLIPAAVIQGCPDHIVKVNQ